MAPRRPPGSAPEAGRISSSGIGEMLWRRGPPAPILPWERGRPARIRKTHWSAGFPLGARASRPHPGDALVGGWRMPGSPSPSGLRARGRAHLQLRDWRNAVDTQPASADFPLGARASRPPPGDALERRFSPGSAGVPPASGRRVGRWLAYAWLPVALRAPRPRPGASPAPGLATRCGDAPPAPILPWERGRPARIRKTHWSVAGICLAPRRPPGSAPEAGRISSSGIGETLWIRSPPAPISPWERGRLARIRETRWSVAGVCLAPRRPPGSAPEAGRISSCGIGEMLWRRDEPAPNLFARITQRNLR
jgi:hypothetical protein